MKNRMLAALASGVGGSLLILGLSFPRFFFEKLLAPTATALWLLLRLTVLAIDQQSYWWGLILMAAIGASGFLLRRAMADSAAPAEPGAAAIDPPPSGRSSILRNAQSSPATDSLRKDLVSLLASLYSAPYRGFAKYQARDALKAKRIALPEGVRGFLFASGEPKPEVPSILADPLGWARAASVSLSRAVGALKPARTKAKEYLRSVDEALSFIERKMESTDEHEPEP